MMVFLLLISLNISPLVNKANKLYNKEKYEEAYELYKKATILYPDKEKIKFNLADCSYKLKRYREAADGYASLSMSKDKDLREKSLYNLGNTFMEVQQFKDAISVYKQALLLNPDDIRAKRNLEIAKMMQKLQEEQKEKEDKEEGEKEEQKEQQEDRVEEQIMEALQKDQKETMENALKRQVGGRRREAGKW